MSHPADDTSHDTASAGNQLTAPADVTALDERILYLSALVKPLLADRAELQGALRLRLTGSVAKYDVWATIRSLHFVLDNAQPEDSVSDQPEQLADMTTAWNNLQALANGNAIPVIDQPEPDSDEYEAWLNAQREHTKLWLRQLMAYIGKLSSFDSGEISSLEAAGSLPGNIRHQIEYRQTLRLLGSPYALGVTLESTPTHGGSCFGDATGLALLEALAHSVSYTIKEVQEAWPPVSQRIAEARGRLSLHWMILKGFVHSMVHASQGQPLTNGLYRRPELVTLVEEALTRGHATITDGYGPGLPVWGGQTRNIGEVAEKLPTPELIAKLHERVEEGRQSAELRRQLLPQHNPYV